MFSCEKVGKLMLNFYEVTANFIFLKKIPRVKVTPVL